MAIKRMVFHVFLLLLCSFAAGGRTTFRRIIESGRSGESVCELLVETNGYSCEEHRVTTKDGYILGLQRIPTGRSRSTKNGAKTPVLLQHGLMSDASTWLSNSPDEALGFILADSGYDVWLSNVRGTNYSSGHISLSYDDPAYWNWSWDELVLYDLPAAFQYVYQQTGQKLHYVGHSLGTLMAFGAFSRREVVGMARSAALLSPIAYLSQMPSPLARIAADAFIGEDLYWLGLKEFSPSTGVAKLVDDVCNIINCDNLESIFTGPNCCLNTSKTTINLTQPTATKNLIHLAQMIRRGKITMYNYGNEEHNSEYYGQSSPPEYNMANIPAELPLYLSYGGRDLLADVNDVKTLIESLSDHDHDKLVLHYIGDYAHLDFVYGVNANHLVYKSLVAFLRQN